MGYLERVFEIARDIDPDQPLTAAPWSYPDGYGVSEDAQLEPIQKRAVELSDIVSFHQYENFERVRQAVNGLSKEGRPLINTEWLNRILDNNISELLPYFYETGSAATIGAGCRKVTVLSSLGLSERGRGA